MTNQKGFTFIEVVTVVGLLGVLLAFSFSATTSLQRSQARKSHQEVLALIQEASLRARGGVQGSSWGVRFVYDDVSGQAVSATLFAGETYATRDTSHDITISISDLITFSEFNITNTGSGSADDDEVAFTYLTGAPLYTGTIRLSSYEKESEISIPSTGVPLLELL